MLSLMQPNAAAHDGIDEVIKIRPAPFFTQATQNSQAAQAAPGAYMAYDHAPAGFHQSYRTAAPWYLGAGLGGGMFPLSGSDQGTEFSVGSPPVAPSLTSEATDLSQPFEGKFEPSSPDSAWAESDPTLYHGYEGETQVPNPDMNGLPRGVPYYFHGQGQMVQQQQPQQQQQQHHQQQQRHQQQQQLQQQLQQQQPQVPIESIEQNQSFGHWTMPSDSVYLLPQSAFGYSDGTGYPSFAHEHGANVLQSSSSRTSPSESIPPQAAMQIIHSNSTSAVQRRTEDQILLDGKRAGLTYKEIRRKMHTHVAESTLRGRYRSLTKPRKDRVRKPVWGANDIQLLKEVVESELDRLDTACYRYTSKDQRLAKLSWKRVGEYIASNGGSYHFGNSTCKKKWAEMEAAGAV